MDAARRTSMRIREIKNASGVPPMPQRKTPAQASKEYRERLKQDPEAYELHRKYERIRHTVFMDQLDEEKRAQYRAKTCLRVRKYRAKQKAEGLAKPPVKAITRAAQKIQLAKWKENKRRQLANETSEARDRRNARRRELYAMKNQPQGKKVRNDSTLPSGPSPTHGDTEPTPSVSAPSFPSTSPSSSGYKTKNALRQAAFRASKALPKDSIKAAEVIEKLVVNATPTKKKALKSKMILSPNSKKRLDFHSEVVTELAETLKRLKKKRSKENNRTRITLALALKRKYMSISQRSHLGIGYKIADKVEKGTNPFQRKVRKDAVSASTVALVEEFYRRADFSRQLPDARGTKRRRNGTVVARRVMERSVAAIHEAFRSEHPECTVGKSLFAALRPDDVLPTTSCRKRDCLCEYCANIDLKLEALRGFAANKGLTCTFKDRYEVSRSTLCPKGESGEYQRECLDRQCNSCGTTAIDNHLQPLLESHMQETITYKKWTHVLRNGKKRLMRIKRTTPIPDFVDEMVSDMAPFSKHLFDASWQSRQYEHVSRCPEKDTVVICEDYAENYKTEYQDEAQGAHWNYEQVTLHASVASYKCQQADCNLTVTESVVFVSDDPKHDAHAIQHFHHMLMTHLQGQDRPPFKKAIFFSDSAPCQYKNKTSFMDLSCAEEDFGITAERHFFGTRHGKGPCDREFGTLKGSVGRRIKMRAVEIDSAKTFFDFVEENYSRPAPPRGEENHCHFQRKFFFVKKEDVRRERPHVENLKPVPNTRQQHSIRKISRGVVAFRERSCFCEVCLGKEQGECPSHSLTGDWNIFSLLKGQRGILLVYDITNKWSFDGIDRWIREVNEHAPGVPKILVGNRLHLAFRRQISEACAEAYALKNDMAFFEVSPLCDFNVTESFAELSRMALKRNGMGRTWGHNKVLSLQELACRTVVAGTTIYGIDQLPLPNALKSYLKSYALTNKTRARMRSFAHRDKSKKPKYLNPSDSPPMNCRKSCSVS